MIIREEQPGDQAAIRQLIEQAFETTEEADLVDQLRAGGHSFLSLVAVHEQEILGHILFTPLSIQTAQGVFPSLSLAPLAVHPRAQRQGIGSQLTRTGLQRCRERGATSVIVLGHAEYYPRFGFSAALAQPLKSPFSGEHWMALELVPGALSGVEGTVQYAPPFGI